MLVQGDIAQVNALKCSGLNPGEIVERTGLTMQDVLDAFDAIYEREAIQNENFDMAEWQAYHGQA